VRNARLFAQTQDALYEAQRLQRLYTGEAWQKFATAQPTSDYEFRQSSLPPLQEVPTPEAMAALEQEQTVDLRFPTGDFGSESGNGESAKKARSETEKQKPVGQASEMGAALATPLKLRDEIIGVLGIHDENPDRRWSEEELALIEGVAEQMSLALENARLFDETGRRAGRERIIADVTRQVWASGELERVMQTAAEQLGTVLDASKVVVRLGTEDQLPVSPQDASSNA
jgi:K+-sensing histidine kinase KdpD